MLNYSISDKEYEDGCFQGIFQIMNPHIQEVEMYTFVFDKEINSLELVRRIIPAWNSPLHDAEMSEYIVEHYYEIKEIIERAFIEEL